VTYWQPQKNTYLKYSLFNILSYIQNRESVLGLFFVWLCVFVHKHIHIPITARKPLAPNQKRNFRILHFSYHKLGQKYKIMKMTVDQESSRAF